MDTPFTLNDDLETVLTSLVSTIPHKNADIVRLVIKAFLENYLQNDRGGRVQVTARQDGSIFHVEVEVVGLEGGSWNSEFEFLT